MNEELFTKCYIDEGMPKLLAKSLRKEAFDVVRAEDLGNTRLSDAQQLKIAVELDRTFSTDDKTTFFEDSGANKIIKIRRECPTPH